MAGGRFVGILLCATVMIAGCGGPEGPPLKQAYYHFQRGQFDNTMKIVDQAVPQTSDPATVAELLVLKGRCYWEMAYLTDYPANRKLPCCREPRRPCRNQSTPRTTPSRDISGPWSTKSWARPNWRQPTKRWRQLDEALQRAYINEKPEEVLLDLRDLGQRPSSAPADAESDDREYSPGDALADGQEEDDEASDRSRAGDVPGVPLLVSRQRTKVPPDRHRGSTNPRPVATSERDAKAASRGDLVAHVSGHPQTWRLIARCPTQKRTRTRKDPTKTRRKTVIRMANKRPGKRLKSPPCGDESPDRPGSRMSHRRSLAVAVECYRPRQPRALRGPPTTAETFRIRGIVRRPSVVRRRPVSPAQRAFRARKLRPQPAQ